MIRYEDALAMIHELCRGGASSEELVPLACAPGRVLARELRVGLDLPRFDNSAMDGFAVVASASVSASPEKPFRLGLQQVTAAGDPSLVKLRDAFSAVEVMTGAPLPEGADSVIRLEDVTREQEGARTWISLSRPVRYGENVRRRGSDQKAGELLASPGTCIGSAHLPVLAAQGYHEVAVRRRPLVKIIATGKELVNPGLPLRFPSQIYNASSALLEAWMHAFGSEVAPPRLAGDDPGSFRELVRMALTERTDFLVTTGAVSMGRHDYVADALVEEGAEFHFRKCAIRPGKPICFGEIRRGEHRCFLLCLPGNPVSTAVGARFFLAPALRAWLGLAPERLGEAALLETVKKPEGFTCFFRGELALREGRAEVKLLSDQGSHVVGNLPRANCWVRLEPEGGQVSGGRTVFVMSWEPLSSGGIG